MRALKAVRMDKSLSRAAKGEVRQQIPAKRWTVSSVSWSAIGSFLQTLSGRVPQGSRPTRLGVSRVSPGFVARVNQSKLDV